MGLTDRKKKKRKVKKKSKRNTLEKFEELVTQIKYCLIEIKKMKEIVFSIIQICFI